MLWFIDVSKVKNLWLSFYDLVSITWLSSNYSNWSDGIPYLSWSRRQERLQPFYFLFRNEIGFFSFRQTGRKTKDWVSVRWILHAKTLEELNWKSWLSTGRDFRGSYTVRARDGERVAYRPNGDSQGSSRRESETLMGTCIIPVSISKSVLTYFYLFFIQYSTDCRLRIISYLVLVKCWVYSASTFTFISNTFYLTTRYLDHFVFEI